MVEQDDMIVNTEYFDKMIDRANGAMDCSELNALAKEAMDAIKAQQAAILKQIEALMPILALLHPPTSLTAIIKWVKNFITSFLTPYLQPYKTYVLQLTLMAEKLAELAAAMEAAAKRLTTCKMEISLDLPPITLPPFEFPEIEPDPVPDPSTTPPTTTSPTT